MTDNRSFRQENIDRLNKEAWDLKYIDGRKALETGKKALTLSEENNYHLGKGEALLITGIIEFWFAESENYLEKLVKAGTIFEHNGYYIGLARTKIYLGSVFDTYGDYNAAIENCHAAIRICEEHQFSIEEAEALTILGQINMRIGDYEKAIESFHKALLIRTELDESMAMGSSYNLLARAYLLNKDFDKSREYYKKSLELRKEIEDYKGLPWTMLGLATLYETKGEYLKAINYYEKGLQLNVKNQDKRYQLMCNIGLSKVLIETGDNDKPANLLHESLKIANGIKSTPVLADVNLVYSKLSEKKEDYSQSLKYYKEYNRLKESINSTETANKLKNQQIAFSIEKSQKEAEIYQLRNVELKNAYDEVEKKNIEVLDSINYARRIQSAILPSAALLNKLLPDSFLLYLPRNIVSGDFYWITESMGKVFFSVADCTGHGVPGALLSIIGKIALDRSVEEFKLFTPAEILDKLSILLKETFATSENKVSDGMDISLCTYNHENGILEFAGARNSLFLVRENELTVYKADRQSIESSDKLNPFTNYSIQIKTGDTIYIFSDGYADQFGGDENKKFMTKKLKELCTEIGDKSIVEQKVILEDTFINWKGNHEQIDDVCILGVKF